MIGDKIIYNGLECLIWGRSLTNGNIILYRDGNLLKMA